MVDEGAELDEAGKGLGDSVELVGVGGEGRGDGG